MAWLKLIRWTNLLIIFLTQILAWACVILPMQQHGHTQFLLDFGNLALLSVSTVLIAAAGYIINDYFDVRIDNINRPDKMVLEKSVPRRQAIILHTVLNIIATILALKVAHEGGHYSWIFMQLGCTLLLWFYSTRFKQRFMIGNVTVALLTAFTIVTLILYEPAMHYYLLQPAFVQTSHESRLPNPVWVLMVYTYFAFVLTWMREIVKDMEDFKGDEAEGCVTMPIIWGLKRSVRFTELLGVFALAPLVVGVFSLIQKGAMLLGIYTAVALILPIIAWMAFLPRKATTKHYAIASRWLKIIMIAGIGSLILYYLKANA